MFILLYLVSATCATNNITHSPAVYDCHEHDENN